MKWFTQIFQRRSLANPSEETRAFLGGSPTAAGMAINAQTAMRSSATAACVRVIGEVVGGLPIHVFRRGPDGNRERDRDHPANAVLQSPNPWTGGVSLRAALQVDALLHGAGYAQVLRAGGRPRELHRLTGVTEEIDDLTGEPRYRVRLKNGGERVLHYSEIMKIATPGSVPGRALCLLDCAREAIGVDLAMSGYQGKLFGNGARPSGVLKVKKVLNEAALERLKKAWQAAHGGNNAAGVAVLEEGCEWESIALSLVDAQFLELRRFAVQEIARIFKVPLTLIGDLDRAVWRNVEELAQQFLTFGLSPWLEVWEEALTRVLFTEEERKTYFIEFQTDDLVRSNIAARFTAYRQAAGGAWLTPNEIRALDNRPPVDGGDELIRQAGQDSAVPAARPEPEEPPLRDAA